MTAGEGLADCAMDGVDVVVDLANSPSFEDAAVLSFFVTAGHNIPPPPVPACATMSRFLLWATSWRPVAISGKIAQERLIRDSGLPYTIIHSTQFFEFLPGIIQSASDGETLRLPAPTCSRLPPRMLPKRWHVSRSSRRPMAC